MTGKEYNRQYQKDTYDTYKRLHLCVRCRQQDAYTLNGHALCFECAEKNRNYGREYKKKNKKTLSENAHRIREYNAKNNLCTQCGKPLELNSAFKICKNCRTYNRYRHEKWRRKKGIMSRECFAYLGKCYMCGKGDVVVGKKVCKECLNKLRSNMTFAMAARNKGNYFRKLNKTFWNSFRNV